MTSLRQKMTDKMTLRCFAASTHEAYLHSATRLSQYYSKSPTDIRYDEIEAWFLHLIKNDELSPSSIRQYFSGLKFLYCYVLGNDQFLPALKLPKKLQRIPEFLSRTEVNSILKSTTSLRDEILLTVCYGCGLRVSEVTKLAVRHIDSEQHLLRIEQSKGNKDRYVPLSEKLIERLREYWRAYRPTDALFPGRYNNPIGISIAQKIYTKAKAKAEIKKVGGIHALRHAFASHQLDRGMQPPQLQDIMGHSDLRTTMRYYRWCPSQQAKSFDLIAQLENDDE